MIALMAPFYGRVDPITGVNFPLTFLFFIFTLLLGNELLTMPHLGEKKGNAFCEPRVHLRGKLCPTQMGKKM